jgi:hypothetical protein
LYFLFNDFLIIKHQTKDKKLAFSQNSSAMSMMEVEQLNDDLFFIRSKLLESLATENFIATDTVIFRRELLGGELSGFTEELSNSGDFELWWRMALSGVRFAYLNTPYLIRHKYQGGLSSSSVKHYKSEIKSIDLRLQESLNHDRKDLIPLLKCEYRNAWQNLILEYSIERDNRGVFLAFIQSIRYGIRLGSFRLLFEALLVELRNTTLKSKTNLEQSNS